MTFSEPGLALKGAMLPTHSVLKKDPSVLGTDDDALYCATAFIDFSRCCIPPAPINTQSPGIGGNWYLPSGRALYSVHSLDVWYAEWLRGAVLMNYRGDGGDSGLFRCDIIDLFGDIQQFYVCMYADGSTNECECI